MQLPRRIAIARGEEPVDLLLENGKLINVFSGEIHDVSVAIHEDRVVGFGQYEARRTEDLGGRYVCPGLIDGHLHLESSMLSIPEFAGNVVTLGTTSVVADPHEIANVLGLEGIRFVLDSSEGLPLRVFVMLPSCVPATPFETSGATLCAADLAQFKDHERVLGLAEVMNFPGVLFQDPDVLAKIEVFRNRVIDGHAPGLSGKDLAAYVSAGIGSDHECTVLDEAREKLRNGMRVMIRQGSAAQNLDALLPVVNEFNSRNCFFVTDDMDPRDIEERGHISGLVRMAIKKGMAPIRAVQMATIHAATYFRLRGLGAVLPGYLADLLILDDLEQFKICRVYQNGRLVAEQGKLLVPSVSAASRVLPVSMNVNWDKVRDFIVSASAESMNVIQVVRGQIVTRRVVERAAVLNGHAVADPARDLLKIAVIERHHGTGSYSVGFIRGFGLARGAMACTVAHDSHNIIVVGASDGDMMVAARELAALGGGMLVVDNARVIAKLPLPIAGLMSDRPVAEVRSGLDAVTKAAQGLGCTLEAPFATLSFMALTPIPELKITDQGLFDSVNFRFVSLFAE
ncbi:MAG: adenine deaminase [Thermodesulfobacteriota bacterium]